MCYSIDRKRKTTSRKTKSLTWMPCTATMMREEVQAVEGSKSESLLDKVV